MRSKRESPTALDASTLLWGAIDLKRCLLSYD
jgi:hypothetical protein